MSKSFLVKSSENSKSSFILPIEAKYKGYMYLSSRTIYFPKFTFSKS